MHLDRVVVRNRVVARVGQQCRLDRAEHHARQATDRFLLFFRRWRYGRHDNRLRRRCRRHRTGCRQADALPGPDPVTAAKLVERDQRRDARLVRLGDLGQGVAAADRVEEIGQLLVEHGVRRQVRDEAGERHRRRSRGQTQLVALRQILAALPDRRLQPRVMPRDLALRHAGRPAQAFGRYIGWQRYGGIVGRLLRDHAREVLFRILVDFHGREKGNIEIPGSESESPPLVVAQDVDESIVTVDAHRATHAGKTVVVCRDCHRPAAGQRVVVREQAGGTARRSERIIAVVDDVINAHVASPCTARELPEARCAHMRSGIRVVGRLDMRQRGDLDRHALCRKLLVDIGAPTPGPLESLAEPFTQPLLVANLSRGAGQRAVADVARP